MEAPRDSHDEREREAPPPLGRHLLADLFGCDARVIDDRGALEALAREAVGGSGATLLGVQSHAFTPQGVTVLAMIAESHLALHAWPEHGYLALDYFTCGDHIRGARALEIVRARVGAERVETREVPRGARPRER